MRSRLIVAGSDQIKLYEFIRLECLFFRIILTEQIILCLVQLKIKITGLLPDKQAGERSHECGLQQVLCLTTTVESFIKTAMGMGKDELFFKFFPDVYRQKVDDGCYRNKFLWVFVAAFSR